MKIFYFESNSIASLITSFGIFSALYSCKNPFAFFWLSIRTDTINSYPFSWITFSPKVTTPQASKISLSFESTSSKSLHFKKITLFLLAISADILLPSISLPLRFCIAVLES